MKLIVKFSENNRCFSPKFGEVVNVSDGGYDRGYSEGYEEGLKKASSENAYEGAYEITPTVAGEVLPTKYKTMTDDLTIKSIPRHDVSNLAGGTTIYIANGV